MIYVASKIAHAPLWREYRDRGFPIRSSWIDMTGDNAGVDWDKFLDEVARAKILVAFMYTWDEYWRGALVEIGCALGFNKPVLLVAPPNDDPADVRKKIGSWISHKRVIPQASIEDAMRIAKDYCL